MKHIFLFSLMLLVHSSIISAQQTKTVLLNANKRVIALATIGDSVIAGGEFDLPYSHIAGVNIATGEIFPLGNGLPDTVTLLFFVPWFENILFASTQKAPYLYTYDLSSLSSDWNADTYFGVTSRVNDVDTIFNQIALATDEGTLVMKELDTSKWYPATTDYIAQAASFDHTLNDGTLYVSERQGTSLMDFESKLYKIKTNDEVTTKYEVALGYVTALFYMNDMDWYNGKLMLIGGLATIPDNGLHTELVTLSPSGSWASFTNGNDCPGVYELSVNEENLYVTGVFFGIANNPDAGPTLALYDGDNWIDPFPSCTGIGYVVEAEPKGKWTVASGNMTQTEPALETQLLVFGSDIPQLTGLPQDQNNKRIAISPNPADDHIYIDGVHDGTYMIQSLIGGPTIQAGIVTENITLQIPAGVYLFTIYSQEGAFTKKLVVYHH